MIILRRTMHIVPLCSYSRIMQVGKLGRGEGHQLPRIMQLGRWAERHGYQLPRIMQLGSGQSGTVINFPESCSREGGQSGRLSTSQNHAVGKVGRAAITFNFHRQLQRRPRSSLRRTPFSQS